MDADQLKKLQEPFKNKYREQPGSAMITLSARSRTGEGVTCSIETGRALLTAGLHPATGGDGVAACSGDMLLEALAACAGVTLNAVATAIGFKMKDGVIVAEGDLDFRGTLGVDKTAPVGFKDIRLIFNLDTDEPPEKITNLIRLTERYCVVYQTLLTANAIKVSVN
jgi:uncharacterized OsmC-like protein